MTHAPSTPPEPAGTGLAGRHVDLVIIGAQKAGTTSLHRYLGAHPEIFFPEQKEVDLFGTEAAFERGVAGVAEHYRGLADEKRVGLSYVGMLFLPGAAERAHAHNPKMQVVALVREPVARAYSAYWYHRRTGWEDAPTFEDALAREDEGRLPPGPIGRALAYQANGCYAEQLRPWLDAFGRDRVRVMETRELARDPAGTVRSILEWIGVTPDLTGIDVGERHNASALPRSRVVASVLGSPSSRLKRVYHRLVPGAVRRPLKRQVTRRLERLNQRAGAYPPMAEATRARLAEFYAPHNDALRELLGLALADW